MDYKFKNREEETLEVKRFLKQKGYDKVEMDYGRGTGCRWISIDISDIPRPNNCCCIKGESYCIPCRDKGREISDQIKKEVKEFAGRSDQILIHCWMKDEEDSLTFSATGKEAT